ncbi:Major facilitator superfamily protein [Citrus sinensis]|nr:Major facilitator superfamily protein [Citrus sinensis]
MEKKSGVSHLFITIFVHCFSTSMVAPAITDVTMSAVCPGRDECSLAIYLSGFQQAVDKLRGPLVIGQVWKESFAYGSNHPIHNSFRSRNFFYAYYVLRTLTAMVCEGSIHCLSLAYVADNVPPGRRASVFGIFSGIVSGAFVCGTISARFISTSAAFQAATAGSIISAVYMRIFLPESVRDEDLYTPILSSKAEISASCEESTKKLQVFKRLPSIDDMVHLLKSSPTFSQAAIVAFLSNLADAGLQGSMMYYLKAKFHFNKNQFADLMVIAGIAGTISQLIMMPVLAPTVGEARLLSFGLLFGCVHMFLYSVAWSSWVPYAAAVFSILSVFSHPCLRTIVSKQVASNEQGKAQGCISGICSFANLVSPLAFSPLTALFLSDRAPFNFPGFSIMCIGFVSMTAFIQSIMIRVAPPLPVSSQRVSNCNSVVA